MLFDAATFTGLAEGRVHCTYRRWRVVRPKPGSRFTTAVGVVEVMAITPVDDATLTEADAYAAGFASLAALLRWLSRPGEGELYRIDIRLAGPDPRIALRTTEHLSPADRADLTARLQRMDKVADQPWTHPVLEQISRRPGVVSTELAAEAGQDRAYYKLRVRRLKALGLTESLEVGYRLSPRGRAYLSASEPR